MIYRMVSLSQMIGKKYSVGENAGMKLNAEGGIEIYVAAEKPKGAPEENWLYP